jgi:hypothetical protein
VSALCADSFEPQARRYNRTPNSALERLFSGFHFGMDDWGERVRPACGFGRRARTIVGQMSWLKGFRRDAENGNRDGRAPHFRISHLNGSFPVFVLGWTIRAIGV